MAGAQSTFGVMKKRHSLDTPPQMNICLLGNSQNERSDIGNFILGREAFDTNHFYTHCERARGSVEGRTITVINTPNLLDPNLTYGQLLEHLQWCRTLCDPGPHVLLMVLKPALFDEGERNRMQACLDTLSGCSLDFSMVCIPVGHGNTLKLENFMHDNKNLYNLVLKCRRRHYIHTYRGDRPLLLQQLDQIIEGNQGKHLSIELYEDPSNSTREDNEKTNRSKHERSNRNSSEKDDEIEQKGKAPEHDLVTTKTPGVMKKRHSKDSPPQMNICLLGNSQNKRSDIGNFILGRQAFDTNHFYTHCERARGSVKGRSITVINTPNLLDPNLTDGQLQEHLQWCRTLCDPGPHVLLMVLKPDHFNEGERSRMQACLDTLSSCSLDFSIVCIPVVNRKTLKLEDFMHDNESLYNLVLDCNRRHYIHTYRGDRPLLLEQLDQIIEGNQGKHLSIESYEDPANSTREDNEKTNRSKRERSNRNSSEKDDEIEQKGKAPEHDLVTTKTPGASHRIFQGWGKSDNKKTLFGNKILGGNLFSSSKGHTSKQSVSGSEDIHGKIAVVMKPPYLFVREDQFFKRESLNKRTPKNTFKHLPRLNIILCGSGENTEIANSLLIECDSVQEPYPGFMKKEGDMCEHRVTLIQVPALFKTHLAQEEVMRETLHCLSLCDPPGVHAFLLVMPVHPLTDDDKGELKTLQGIFGARFNENLRVVFKRDYLKVEKTTVEFLEKNAEGLLNACNRRYDFFDVQKAGNGMEILAEIIKAIKKGHNCYKLYDFVKAKETALKEDLDVKHHLQLTKMKKEYEETIKTLTRGAESQPSSSESLRIVLIGKTGNGKSASGNTILGRPEFESDTSPDSVTTFCQKAICEVDGREVAVVDTPGLFDTTLSNTEIQQEIVKCISLSAPGPHAFLIVLSIGRITQEELDSLKFIKATFGVQATHYAIVLFTRGDDLKQKSIQDYVGNAKNANLKKLINDCGGRYHVFNNNKNLDRTQVSKLFEKICAMTSKNKDSYYTNDMFNEAELAIQQKQDEILKEKEEEIKAEMEKLKLKHETEMKEISLKLEKERLEFQKERERGEKEVKKKEEMIKRNYEEKESKANMKRQSEDLQRKKAEKKQREQWEAERKTMEREILIQKAELERSNMVKEREYREIIEKQRNEDTVKEEKLKCQVQELTELKRKQEEENNRRDEDETKRKKKETEEKEIWEKRIKEAERDQSEMQQELKKNAMEWEERLMKERKIREEDEQLRRKMEVENLAEQTGKHSQMKEEFEREINQNRLMARRAEDQRDRERKERDRVEKELEERMKEHTAKTKKQQEEWEKDREKEREFRQQEDEKRREAEKTKIKKLEDDFNRELEEAEQKRKKENIARKEKEERRIKEMEEQFERKTTELMSKHENEARKQAEEFNDFRDKYEKDFKQLLKKHDEEQEKLTKRYKAEYDTLSSLYSNDKEQLISKIKEIEKKHEAEKKGLEEAKKTAEELFLKMSEKNGICVLL